MYTHSYSVMPSSITIPLMMKKGVLWQGEQQEALTPEAASMRVVSTGISSVDAILPFSGIPCSALHECVLQTGLESVSNISYVPYSFLRNIFRAFAEMQPQPPFLVYIGRSCWPSAHYLQTLYGQQEQLVELSELDVGMTDMRTRSYSWGQYVFFVDPPNKELRVWSAIQVLRICPQVMLIMDGAGLSFTAFRRLQLAAQRSSALFFIIRPPQEAQHQSLAYSKWCISPLRSHVQEKFHAQIGLQWQLELQRCRGIAAPKVWQVSFDDISNTSSLDHVQSIIPLTQAV